MWEAEPVVTMYQHCLSRRMSFESANGHEATEIIQPPWVWRHEKLARNL